MKLYMFRTVPLSIIRSYSLYIQQWYMSYRFVDSFRAAGSGWNCSSPQPKLQTIKVRRSRRPADWTSTTNPLSIESSAQVLSDIAGDTFPYTEPN
jgi:hypothetical protein